MARTSRLLIATAILLSLFVALGLRSSHVCLRTCEDETRSRVAAYVARIQNNLRHLPPSTSFPQHAFGPLIWANAAADTDPTSLRGPWYWFATPYRPDLEPMRLPWAFVRPEPGPLPFLVRVYYGFETTGQAGAGGFDLYVTFFRRAHYIGRFEMWIS